MAMGVSGVLWSVRVLVLLQLVSGILGWGEEGHYATGKIAEGYLTAEALAAVKELLPESAEGDLANVCSWPDEIKSLSQYRWSSALHFADTPDLKCNYEYCRDCHDSAGSQDRCVTGAIYNYTYQLSSAYQNSSSESNYNSTEALIQSTGYKALRSIVTGLVWDDMIIELALKTFYGSNLATMIQSIQNNITENWSNELPSWESCAYNHTACPNPYASESVSLACKFAYRNATQGSTLEDDYFLSRLPVVEKRLAQGGIRLAATLNRIFASPLKIAQA
ncbi:unnamed protein product [Dovyalis caffra]|uniref:Aspergillus nuclease S1 n=1 Tax=Dovyalis caffra TaxID=77055 RepID=A0AAV1SH16_9ROSI|nr:unnamed protein product [Dovyalis caffra]